MDDGTHPVLEILRLGSEHSCNAEWERSSWKSEGQPGERVQNGSLRGSRRLPVLEPCRAVFRMFSLVNPI